MAYKNEACHSTSFIEMETAGQKSNRVLDDLQRLASLIPEKS